jgi:hypothetical protein
MAFSIRTAMDRIVSIQGGLSITSPVSSTISKAYKYPPPGRTMLDTPCFVNWPELTQYDRGMLRQRIYQVRVQLFVLDPDADRAGDIAVAFQDKFAIALDNDLTLAIAGVPSCTLWRNLRGGVRLLEWNALSYIGLDMFMEVVLGGEVPGT